MDVGRQTNPQQDRVSECRSFSSNHRCCSQSRKISIGVLIDSISKADTEHINEPVMQIAEKGTSSKGNCVKDREGHTPLLEKHADLKKDASPWVSTRSFNPKGSSSIPGHDPEHTPSFQVISRTCPRSKLLERGSGAHFLKLFAGKTGLEADEFRQKTFGKATYSREAGKVSNADHVEHFLSSTEPGVLLEKEQAEDRDRKTETGGRETLRMKLWEILGNVSSPNKHCLSSVELHPDQERDGMHSPIEKRNPNSDTIESDSEKHAFRRPMTRSLTQKKASSRNQHKKIEATKSTGHREESPQKRIFSFRGDWSGRLCDVSNDGSLPSKRNKIEREISGIEKQWVHKYEHAEERQQPENKTRSIPTVQKSMVHTDKVAHANSSSDRRNDVLVDTKTGTHKNSSFEPPLNLMAEQKDVEQPADEISNFNDQQKDIPDSLLKNNKNSICDPSTATFEITSPGCLLKSTHGKLQGQCRAQVIFNMRGIRSFKSLLSSKPAECTPTLRMESSDDRYVLNDVHFMKPSFIMEEDSENQMSKLSTGATDSDSSENDSHTKVCRESEQLSSEFYIAEEFLRGPDKSLGKEKDVEGTGCSPMSESLKGIQDSSELQMYLELNHHDGLASAIKLLAVALDRFKTKVKSMSNKRSAEILLAAAEEVFLLLQKAESQIKTDVGKLANLSQSKRKRLETRLEEQQEHFLGVYKRFKEEVDRHLQDYDKINEDLEEHEIEIKRTAERQRAAQKKFLLHLEQAIKVQLDEAESRITTVQELARKKMLQLKLLVAECIKHGAFG
ncbi:Meiosis-specific protein ASY3 [Sesamum alatum]|uniref:Meiosis-specific protein ASY3 n=1 Tax=Sesamum alatum TaxID=300844 RepID=A0AAE1XU26_9LAMI|nr:Meiosis-specific protein ASY3 [Sesamum alatum]